MDKDLERRGSACRVCQEERKFQANRQRLHPWEFPSKPWERVHIDYAGPYENRMFLVVVDAYSKWMEVIPTSGSTAKITISKLRRIFSTHGIPDILVSDNAAAFTGGEFQEFLERNGIRHITGAPYHPATNGLAENAVKSFKQTTKKMEGDMEERLDRFLFDYRITPHSITGVPPCEMLMRRKIKSRFDLIRPSMEARVYRRQEAQMRDHASGQEGKAPPTFTVGDHVYFRDYSGKGNSPGVVEDLTGPVSCRIRTEEGQLIRKHFSQIFTQVPPKDFSLLHEQQTSGHQPRPADVPIAVPKYPSATIQADSPRKHTEHAQHQKSPKPVNEGVPGAGKQGVSLDSNVSGGEKAVPVRRSERIRKPRVKLDM